MYLALGVCANVTDVVLIKWAGDEAIVASSLGLLIGGRGREGLILLISIAFEHCVLRCVCSVIIFINQILPVVRAREILRFKHHNSAHAESLICLLNQVGKLPIPVI